MITKVVKISAKNTNRLWERKTLEKIFEKLFPKIEQEKPEFSEIVFIKWDNQPLCADDPNTKRAFAMWQAQSGKCTCCNQRIVKKGQAVPLIEAWWPKSNVPFAITCGNSRCNQKLKNVGTETKTNHNIFFPQTILQIAIEHLQNHVKHNFKACSFNFGKRKRDQIYFAREKMFYIIHSAMPGDCLADVERTVKVLQKAGANPRKIEKLKMIIDLAKQQDCKCVWCSETMTFSRTRRSDKQATIEHLITRFHGGIDSQPNFLLACNQCNNKRGNQELHIWIKRCQEQKEATQTHLVVEKLNDVQTAQKNLPRRFVQQVVKEQNNFVKRNLVKA